MKGDHFPNFSASCHFVLFISKYSPQQTIERPLNCALALTLKAMTVNLHIISGRPACFFESCKYYNFLTTSY
jgi:hypothetical protein